MKKQIGSVTRVRIAVLLLAVLLASSSALGVPTDTVTLMEDGFGAYGSMAVYGGGLTGQIGRGGVYLLDIIADGDGAPQWMWDPMPAFCIELTEESPKFSTDYEIVMPAEAQKPTDFLGSAIGQEKADYLCELWAAHFDESWFDGSYSLQDRNEAEAFAAALWEIIYEDLPDTPQGWDVTTDGTAGPLGFRACFLDWELANDWLGELDGQGPKADLRALVRDGKQDYLVEVPEPATVALLGIAAAMSLARRRRVRRA